MRLISNEVYRLIDNGRLSELIASREPVSSCTKEIPSFPIPIQFDEENSQAYLNGGENTISRNVKFHLSFQSRVGPVQWLK